MLLDTPFITTLLAALVILGITYTITTLIDKRIAEVRADREKGRSTEAEELPLASRLF